MAARAPATDNEMTAQAGSRIGTVNVPTCWATASTVLRDFVVAELTAADLTGAGDRRHDLERSRAIAAETFRTAVTRSTDLATSPRPR